MNCNKTIIRPQQAGVTLLKNALDSSVSSEGIFTRYAKEGGHRHTMMQCNCCATMVPGVVIQHNADEKDTIPLHMPCSTCGKWIGHLELENHQVLDGMCLGCFEEDVEQ
jgi:hypothetical protein